MWTTRGSRAVYRRTPTYYGTQVINGDYVTVRDVARRLNITTQGVRARIRNGLLPALKVADMWYIKRSDVSERWRTV